MITRRGFLQTFGLAAAAFSMDPERLLWVPGAKTIFIPEAAGKVEVYDMDDFNALLKINQYTFGMVYTNPQDVLRDSHKYKVDPFDLYSGRWTAKDL